MSNGDPLFPYPGDYPGYAEPVHVENLRWYQKIDWSWLQWGWSRKSAPAYFIRTANVILLLALTYYGFQSYVQARYAERLAAGLTHEARPVYTGKADPEFHDLFARLEALDAAIAHARAAGKAELPAAPAMAEMAPVSEQVKVAVAPPPKPESVVAPEPVPQVAPASPPVIVATLNPVPAALTQPALRLQPGLRGSGEGAPSPYGERIWLSSQYNPDDSRLTSLVAAGDTMMGTSSSGLNPAMRPGADAAGVVGADLAGIFRRADIAFVNLEGPLYDGAGGTGKACDNCFAFKSPEFYAGILASLGIDAVSLANNHSGDYGEGGRASTIAALKASGIGAAGLDQDDARSTTLVLPDGKRVAVIAFAPNSGTLNLNDIAGAEKRVRALKVNHDIVVVSFHGGAEGWEATRVPRSAEIFLGENRGNVASFAHRMIDAGAAIVLGHGPHVPRAVEIYKGHLIAYSLGNFWTYGVVVNYAVSGLGPAIEAWLEPDGKLAGLQIHSTQQAGLGVPHLDTLDEAARYVLYLTKKDFPGSFGRLMHTPATASNAGAQPPS